ncbi:hypothetical protein [Streptomyces roseoverticillatus]|uniref:hypothetical protein n=1 Tax=Streptomyces roseoverticillatus TaxID=66429 RepID=UPI000B16D6F8|nr:hypothetical protein [Streptomyces roseoverticillatus]
MFHDDATWTLPGDNTVSGTVVGADAVVERARKIASYGLSFELLHVLRIGAYLRDLHDPHVSHGRASADDERHHCSWHYWAGRD